MIGRGIARLSLYRLTPGRAAALTAAYVVLWAAATLVVGPGTVGTNAWRGGLFLIGLAWAIWLVERSAQRREDRRLVEYARRRRGEDLTARPNAEEVRSARVWDPLDLAAWYYGSEAQRLKQSLLVLGCYAVFFFAALLLYDGLHFGKLIYELPGGGGGDGRAGDAPVVIHQPAVKLKRVVRKKFVINPYSGIIFNAPPIDKFDPKLLEITREEYQAGQGSGLGQGVGVGSGSGPGFGAGTGKGKVRLIRLRYEGGDWDLNFGPGHDQNMLLQYAARTGQKTAERTESVTVSDLARFPPEQSPPVVMLGGQRTILLSNSEKRILREYLVDKHGMVFGDNGGSQQFHHAFIGLMREVTGVEEVAVPLDDILHRSPYRLPFLPYVSPHGGKIALGWKVDGRWLAFYHPGDIGDAWSDGHAGVSVEIWEACYRLGVNVIFYAHVEYNKWLESRRK